MSKLDAAQESQRAKWRGASRKYAAKHRKELKERRYSQGLHCSDCGTRIQNNALTCCSCRQKRERHHRWNGGVHVGSRGYRLVLIPGHPNADKRGYVPEHRLVMGEMLGRALSVGEVVHHIDGNRLNNTLGNLTLFPGRGQHIHHHAEVRRGK
jgi:hypothetical protein